MTTQQYPLWEELPEIELYLDQVLLTQSTLGPNDKGLTASMVNNYVKHGHVAKPIKKKYNAAQVARLIVITSLKTVFEISEIAKTLEILRTDTESQKSYYNDFVACMNGQFPQEAPQVILSACQTLQCQQCDSRRRSCGHVGLTANYCCSCQQRLRHDCCGRDVCFRYQPFPHVFELSHLPCYGLQLTPQDGSKNY